MSDTTHKQTEPSVLLNNKLYDFFKKSSLYILPALGAAYFGIAQIWGLPKAEEVVGTVTVLETLLGVMLRVSQTQYNKSDERFDGTIHISPHVDEDGPTGLDNLNVSLDAGVVYDKDEVLIKVKKDL